MSSVIFGTNNRETALKYIQQSEPSKKHTEESAVKLLDLVEKDVIRIGDPFMYGGKSPITPSDAYTEDMHTEVMTAINSIRGYS